MSANRTDPLTFDMLRALLATLPPAPPMMAAILSPDHELPRRTVEHYHQLVGGIPVRLSPYMPRHYMAVEQDGKIAAVIDLREAEGREGT